MNPRPTTINHRPSAISHSSNERGFTLIEMIASVAILVGMSYLLFAAFNQTSKAWLQGESRVETFTAARAALDLMSRELAQAMVNTNALQFFGTNYVNPCGPFLDANGALAFIAPVGDKYGSRVDLAEIVYRLSQPNALCKGDPAGFFTNTIPPYRLIRRFTPYADSQSTITNLYWDYGQGFADYHPGKNPWDFYNSSGFSYTNWMETSASNNTQVLADNIVSLNFQFVSTNGLVYNYWNSIPTKSVWLSELPAGSVPDPTSAGGSAAMDANHDAFSYGDQYMTNHAPAGVYITLEAVDSRTATRLQALTSNGAINNLGAFTNMLNQAVQTFTTFVAIPNQ
jgi:prepilin-type N-terminal cleavage/methylation domain-containing protein